MAEQKVGVYMLFVMIGDGVLDSTPPLLSRMDARKRNVVGIASDGLEHILINANMYSQFRRDRGLLLGI